MYENNQNTDGKMVRMRTLLCPSTQSRARISRAAARPVAVTFGVRWGSWGWGAPGCRRHITYSGEAKSTGPLRPIFLIYLIYNMMCIAMAIAHRLRKTALLHVMCVGCLGFSAEAAVGFNV